MTQCATTVMGIGIGRRISIGMGASRERAALHYTTLHCTVLTIEQGIDGDDGQYAE
jgi:hypothetical protein